MKTYTIKPLEWVEYPISKVIESGIYSIHTFDFVKCGPCAKLRRSCIFEEPMSFETIKAAKAKAQELHEAEIMKCLQEYHVIEQNDAATIVLCNNDATMTEVYETRLKPAL